MYQLTPNGYGGEYIITDAGDVVGTVKQDELGYRALMYTTTSPQPRVFAMEWVRGKTKDEAIKLAIMEAKDHIDNHVFWLRRALETWERDQGLYNQLAEGLDHVPDGKHRRPHGPDRG